MTQLLVVEDSPPQAQLLRGILEKSGFQVDVASDAEAAVEYLAVNRYHLVISDVGLPGESGFDLCRRIKATDPLLPVVLLTALTDHTAIIQGLQCGAEKFVTKPYRPAYLLRQLLEVLQKKPEAANDPGVDISLGGATFRITREREQILDVLLTAFEDLARTNERLRQREEDLDKARQALEQRTHRLEGQFEAIFNCIPDTVLFLDTEQRIVMCNPAFVSTFGYAADELIGAACNVLFAADKGMEKPRSAMDVETVEFRRKDRQRFVGETVLTAVRDDHTSLLGFIRIIRDITERRKLEEQFLQSQKMEAVGRLAGGIAHDFNNLLTAISGYGEMLLAGKLAPEVSEALHEILGASNRAASLTRQLLVLSRKHVIEPTTLDVNAVVSSMEKMLRRLIGEDVELQVTAASDLSKIWADCGQVEQVLLNLAVNARDAMPGGGKLIINTDNVDLDTPVARLRLPPGRYVSLTVIDSGCGMDAPTMSRIFEPFYTTKPAGQGTGLGLSTVYNVVKQAGGDIFVYSELGLGTSFKIYWPAMQSSVEAAVVPAAPVVGGNETLLLVEDDESLRKLARMILENLGYKILTAGSVEEAMELCQRHCNIDALITDVVMPGGSGFQLAQRVREMYPQLPVIYTSGYTDDAVLRSGIQLSEVAFLAKPFNAATMARKVREVLEGVRS